MRVVLPPIPPGAEVAIAVGSLEPLPPGVDADWVMRRPLAGAPPELVVDAVEARATALAWPAVVVTARLGDVHLLRVFYRFLDYGAVAEARAADAAGLTRGWAILAQARPEWSDLAALCQVFA